MLVALPTEIWIIILCDVLGTYVHSLVLLPPGSRCWHGYRVVRSVSRHLKAIVDDIWCSAVGSEETWREFGKLRTAVLTGEYDGPENWRTSALISAYGAYILNLILQDNPQTNVENAIKAYGDSITTLGFGIQSVPVDWSLLAMGFSHQVRPRQFKQCLYSSIYATAVQVYTDVFSHLLETIIKAARASDGSGMNELEGGLSRLEDYLRLTPFRFPMDYMIVAALKELVRNYPPSEVGDEAKSPVSIDRRKLVTRVASFTEVWSKKYEVIKSHKIAMHRVAIYGVQRADALQERRAIDFNRNRLSLSKR